MPRRRARVMLAPMNARFVGAAFALSVLIAAACSIESPRQRVVGRWNVRLSGGGNTVEIRDDGTLQPRGCPIQYWKLSTAAGDSLVFRMGPSPADMAVEYRLRFRGDSAFTLHRRGRVTTFIRVE